MKLFDVTIWADLAMLLPFGIPTFGVFIAVFGKAAKRFPFQPKEARTFKQHPTLPRSYSKLYVVTPIRLRPATSTARRGGASSPKL